ncbi:MAG: hypothetical protein HPY79_11470 [Bacteroidales bacterium]|nr:hypothetical protein [Bacteroidales bacterium]
MWHQILILNMICLFSSCKTNNVLLSESNGVKLTISTTTNIVSDSINVMVSFENNTDNDFYFLNRNEVTISQNKAYAWNLEVLFKDTVLMISPIYFFSKISKPTKDDYFLLKSGEKYTFNFNVDFKKLVQDALEFGNLNKCYGKYSMRLVYRDEFCIIKNSIRKPIESNTIKVLYKE